jgi:ABC-type antimicrobial peptide transport system permease subunit
VPELWTLGHIHTTNIMKSIRAYGIGRLLLLGFGVGIIVGVLRIAIPALFATVFHVSPSSAWIPFASSGIIGVVVAIVIIYALSYFSRATGDK